MKKIIILVALYGPFSFASMPSNKDPMTTAGTIAQATNPAQQKTAVEPTAASTASASVGAQTAPTPNDKKQEVENVVTQTFTIQSLEGITDTIRRIQYVDHQKNTRITKVVQYKQDNTSLNIRLISKSDMTDAQQVNALLELMRLEDMTTRRILQKYPEALAAYDNIGETTTWSIEQPKK